MKGHAIMGKTEQAASYFRQGYACSQSVLLTFAEQLGLTHELAERIAGGFGGGMGRTGRTCGAVSGAVMALGLAFTGNFAGEGSAAAKEQMYARVRQFFDEFQNLHGSLDCNTLLCVDIATAERRSQAREQGKFSTLCPLLVGDAVRIVDAMLAEANHPATQPAS
jgi:C_GCAxxG_C_C family probable redox protein